MSCFFPLVAWRSRKGRDPATGKWPITFDYKQGYYDLEVKVPCGKCLGCRLDYSRAWALRCMHEAKLHHDNCCVTLTYDPDHLPLDRQLDRRGIQNWLKVLRQRIGPFRFFGCGEYGSNGDRPHYHILLFGYDFPDKVLKTVHLGSRQYDSRLLRDIWHRGHVSVGEASFKSAAYIARYCLKKAIKKEDSTHEVDEFTMMSLKPGIGAGFLEKYGGDMINLMACEFNGQKYRIPNYYLNKMSDEVQRDIKAERAKFAVDLTFEQGLYRLHVAEEMMKKYDRSFEHD